MYQRLGPNAHRRLNNMLIKLTFIVHSDRTIRNIYAKFEIYHIMP